MELLANQANLIEEAKLRVRSCSCVLSASVARFTTLTSVPLIAVNMSPHSPQAIGKRNQVEAETENRKRRKQEIRAMLNEKRAVLDRYVHKVVLPSSPSSTLRAMIMRGFQWGAWLRHASERRACVL